MATEDFSFPIIEDNFPWSIDSPPLWHLSPTASPNSCHEEPPNGAPKGEENDEEDCQRRSFPCVEDGVKMVNDGKEDDEEEKMDMLWEDFNEELSRTYSSTSNTSSSRDMVELGCVKAFPRPKNNGIALSTRKPGMLVIIKVLKKLFLLQSSHRKLKIRGSHSHQ